MVADEDGTRPSVNTADAAKAMELLEEGLMQLMQSATRCACKGERCTCGASERRELVFAFYTAAPELRSWAGGREQEGSGGGHGLAERVVEGERDESEAARCLGPDELLREEREGY